MMKTKTAITNPAAETRCNIFAREESDRPVVSTVVAQWVPLPISIAAIGNTMIPKGMFG